PTSASLPPTLPSPLRQLVISNGAGRLFLPPTAPTVISNEAGRLFLPASLLRSGRPAQREISLLFALCALPVLCLKSFSTPFPARPQNKTAPRDRSRSGASSNSLNRKLSSCSLFAPERLAAASSTPRHIPALYRRRLPPPSESIYPYESGIAPSLRSAATPGACHLSAVSGRPRDPSAIHTPGKAFPGFSCSARRCPAVRPSRTSIPFPATRRPSSP